jgi:hypothetical protein
MICKEEEENEKYKSEDELKNKKYKSRKRRKVRGGEK